MSRRATYIGHSWWRFDIEPASAVPDVIANINPALIDHVGQDVGYFNSINWVSGPGEVRFGGDNGVAEADHNWVVAFEPFLAGVREAEALERVPGLYNARRRNCVWAAIRMGNASGVTMPVFNHIRPITGRNGFWHPDHFADWLDAQ
jgi:hypothetical protein